jgi:thiamine pyrophosphokinase
VSVLSAKLHPTNPEKSARCVIFSGAPDCVLFTPKASDFIIACDHGYDHAVSQGIRPHLLMGDFDSCLIPRDPSIPCIAVSAEKDDTDTMLAVRHGLSLGFQDFLLLGATGGRVDHFWANCSICAFLAKQGARCEMRDSSYTLYTLSPGSLTLRRQKGAFLSVFSFCDVSYGITLEGVKYPLKNATLTNDVPLGVSNEFAAEVARISLRSGLLLILITYS